MIPDEFYNKYYLKTREDDTIIDAFSDGPHNERNTEGYIQFGYGGYQLRLFPDGEENPPLYTMDGIPLYKWYNGNIMERTESEIETDRMNIPEPEPSNQERLEAQVTYTAMMTDTLLEE